MIDKFKFFELIGMMIDNINTTEYQILIGCKDGHTQKELVTEEELRKLISDFFEKKQIDFSMISLKGGFLYDTGEFVVEDTLCINIITDKEDGIITLAKDLSMFMNQKYSLIIKNNVYAQYR